MAPRPRSDLQEILSELDGPEEVYFQAPPRMVFPCIKYERDESWVSRADNLMYLFKKRYQVTVIDRNPDSEIPDQVEALPFTRFERFFVKDGLNHWVYNLYF